MVSPSPHASREITWHGRDGLRLFAREYGDSEADRLPVICIPGLTRNSRDFEEVAPWIAARGRRVIAVDLRGRGRSARDPNPKHYTPLTYVDDVVQLLDSLRTPRALFVGTSLGGIVTTFMALRHLDRVGGAVLNDVGPVLARAGLARIASYASRTPRVTSWDDAIAYARLTGGVAYPLWSDADWMVFVRRIFAAGEDGVPMIECDRGVFRPMPAWVVWVLTPFIWRLFARLSSRRPTMLVRGALSDVLDPVTAGRMRQIAPAMVYVEVPDVGHAPTLSESQARAGLDLFLSTAP